MDEVSPMRPPYYNPIYVCSFYYHRDDGTLVPTFPKKQFEAVYDGDQGKMVEIEELKNMTYNMELRTTKGVMEGYRFTVKERSEDVEVEHRRMENVRTEPIFLDVENAYNFQGRMNRRGNMQGKPALVIILDPVNMVVLLWRVQNTNMMCKKESENFSFLVHPVKFFLISITFSV
ncbi:unnamed protein product [Caenorhabditis nigoni]